MIMPSLYLEIRSWCPIPAFGISSDWLNWYCGIVREAIPVEAKVPSLLDPHWQHTVTYMLGNLYSANSIPRPCNLLCKLFSLSCDGLVNSIETKDTVDDRFSMNSLSLHLFWDINKQSWFTKENMFPKGGDIQNFDILQHISHSYPSYSDPEAMLTVS